MQKPKIISRLTKKSGIEILISLCEFKDENRCDIREYYSPDKEKWLPTKKGISISFEMIEELIEGLKLAKKEITNMGESNV